MRTDCLIVWYDPEWECSCGFTTESDVKAFNHKNPPEATHNHQAAATVAMARGMAMARATSRHT